MRRTRVAFSALAAAGVTLGLLWLLSAAATSTSVAHASPGTTRYVATTGTDSSNDCTNPITPCVTIQHAVDQVSSDDEVWVAAGTYTGTNGYGGLSQVVYISKSVVVRGGYTSSNWTASDPEANPVVVDAEGNGRVFYITGDISSTLEGLSITGGDATGLFGSPYGENCGGAIYGVTAAVTISECSVYSNVASIDDGYGYGGAAYLNNCESTLVGNSITSNTACIETGSFQNSGWGGGLCFRDGSAVLESNSIRNNIAIEGYDAYGGGICMLETDAILKGNSIISNAGNTAKPPGGYDPESRGGGIQIIYGNEVQLIDNTIRDNTASKEWEGWGGGAWIGFTDRVTLTGNTIEGNRAGDTYESSGGGIALYYYGEAFIANNWIISNTACTGSEGGLSGGLEAWSPNTVTIDGNYIMSNTASLAGPGSAGGVAIVGSLSATLRNNYILGNVASTEDKGYGGGLYLGGRGFTLTNNLIADNILGPGGKGAGIYVPPRGSGRLWHNTIANNSGGDGSGFTILACDHFCQDNIFSFRNNIIASQAVGIRIGENSTATVESNLWWNNGQDWSGDGTITANNNYTGNPAFIPGLMDDYHIGPSSAALDRGVDAGVATDIDGDPRPLGGKPDLGADEYRYPLDVLKEWHDLDGPPLQVGDPIQYAISVTNHSSQTMTGVTVTDTLPTGIQFTSATPPGYTGPDPLVWQISSLPASATWTATITATVDGSADPIGGNVASVSSNQQEQVYTFPIGGGNVHCFAVHKTAHDLTGPPLYEGNEIEYVISVTNECATPMAGVVVTDTLPAGVEFEFSIPSASTGPNPLVWQVGLLAAEGVWTATVSVEVDGTSNPIGGNVVVVGNAEGEELETEPILPPGGGNIEPGLGIEKTAEDMNGFPLHIDDPIQYVITVTNQSGATGVTGVVVTDTIPAGVTFLSATGTYSGPNTLVWNLGDLAASEVWTAGVMVIVNGAANPIGGNVALAKGRQTLEVTTDPILPNGGGTLEASPSGYLPLVVHK